ncbi:MAG: carbonic anhydrase [Xanthobacter sp.]
MKRRSFLAGLALCPICASAALAQGVPSGASWGYEGTGGPEHWGTLEKAYAACAIGAQQSPVNLQGAVRAEAAGPLLGWKLAPFKVVNNGHTIQLDVEGDAGGVLMNGKPYALRQFHFHAPSEHAIEGQRTAMEAHFVHMGEEGRLLVIGVFLVPGEVNDAFSTLMAAAPKKQGSVILEQPMDPSALLPKKRALYRYEGSLTTPPCAEVVDWNIYAAPVHVDAKDIEAFRAIFPMNARPLQAMNRRFLLQMQ